MPVDRSIEPRGYYTTRTPRRNIMVGLRGMPRTRARILHDGTVAPKRTKHDRRMAARAIRVEPEAVTLVRAFHARAPKGIYLLRADSLGLDLENVAHLFDTRVLGIRTAEVENIIPDTWAHAS